METPSDQESSGIDLRITVCSNGAINVLNTDGDGHRAHSVFVDESGDVIRCSCKGHHYRGHCSHAEEIAQRPLVRSSAVAAQASTQRVATDGGFVDETADGYERIGKHRGRCVECGNDGPLGMDGNPVVLHERDCEQAQRERTDDVPFCDECGHTGQVGDDFSEITHHEVCSEHEANTDGEREVEA